MNEEAEQVFSWFTAFNKKDLEEIFENLSVEQRTRLRMVLEQERAEQVKAFDAAMRVSEQVLEIIGNEAHQLGFDLPPPCPSLTAAEKLTQNLPKDQEWLLENERIRFANVVRKLNELLAHWEEKRRKNEDKK